MIEVAIALPILILLVFGAIDWGMLRQQQHALAHGVREGARRAAVAEWGTETSCTSATAWPGTVRTICATKAAIDEPGVAIRVLVPQYRVGQTVTVCAQRPADTLTGITDRFVTGQILRSITRMRIEELGNGGMNSATEDTTRDWSWCT
ncbi:MAG TPA: TadE family protein [Vicinamibacterales bacterium]|nr:TadE family protein [Vicinamibacterales bacterium]